VQEIIDRADVGRATFYAHFQDKDDLLVQGLAMFSDQLDEHLAAQAHDGEEASHMLHSLSFFRHADLHHDLYRAMREGGGWEIVQATARRHLTEDIERHLDAWFPEAGPAEMPVPVITNFLTGAMLSILMCWLDAGRPCSPEEVNNMFQQLAMAGVGHILQHTAGGPA
jgi:AcrR family transcriptional regulator